MFFEFELYNLYFVIVKFWNFNFIMVVLIYNDFSMYFYLCKSMNVKGGNECLEIYKLIGYLI